MTTRTLVLIGGGHAHIQVLPEVHRSDTLDVVLIANAASAYYSGMIPGHVAGMYDDDQCKVSLPELCRHYGWTFIQGTVFDINAEERKISYTDRNQESKSITYDFASIDVGSCTRNPFRSDVSACRHVVFTRPISDLNTKISTALAMFKVQDTTPNIVVIGAGAAGVELAFAVNRQARETLGQPANVTLMSRSSPILRNYARSTIRKTMASLHSKHINVKENCAIVDYREEEHVVVDTNGSTHPADLLIVATGAAPHAWVTDTSLPKDERGFIRVDTTLQVVGYNNLFAVGDCNSFDAWNGEFPPKAGVYAVREGPILVHNLKAVLNKETQRLKRYQPQSDFLSLLITGDGAAIGTKWNITMKGRWVWRLKDHIDRTWMAQFKSLSHDTRHRHEGQEQEDEAAPFQPDSDADVNMVSSLANTAGKKGMRWPSLLTSATVVVAAVAVFAATCSLLLSWPPVPVQSQ
ncbi:hypothetical protein PTSG_03505 [Salpingoeca rosetta]|uniref:FAD/NAD(P)-binding domain-containing protein n=1 Tax=Salpingoeca rosetta (strain ATCC 50818 / BSB-021) TaxID=946362 RepID=F2U5T4_SALR5|nr:uncharacterized protein PTSG_03505 [Salpingoeca rosetta]EGD82875.1 hypothetical protein PTSG_03505 [Salpingoeca rosetta]|eukprot:XP_004995239.1 hypothetical protein PTSG_03505 [Salpingoeca rosetta]